jgi:hypothetical protein
MEKINYKKELKKLYHPPAGQAAIVDVPEMNFLMIDGRGDPNTAPAYQEAIETLYFVSYTLKFMIKKADQVDYGVMPLEGLWWAEDMTAFTSGDKSQWLWTSMIMQPPPVTPEKVAEAIRTVQQKKNPPGLAKIRFEAFREGLCAQVMHIGSFSDEGPTIEKMHQFIISRGCELRDKHHEIYLSDFRRTVPEKLKTVIRQPMCKID